MEQNTYANATWILSGSGMVSQSALSEESVLLGKKCLHQIVKTVLMHYFNDPFLYETKNKYLYLYIIHELID